MFLALATVGLLNTPLAAGAPPDGEMHLVGVVTEHGVGVCEGGRETVWTNKHLRVGAVQIAPGSVNLQEWLGRRVVVTGRVSGTEGPRPSSPLGTTPCGMEQMRNDWYATPSGTARWDGGATPFGALVVTKVEAFDGVELSRKGKDITLSVKAPVGEAWSLTLSLEYLGNAGKPGSEFAEKALTVKGGKTAKVSFPESVQMTKGEPHSGYSAQTLRVTGGNATHFLDLSLSAPGPRK